MVSPVAAFLQTDLFYDLLKLKGMTLKRFFVFFSPFFPLSDHPQQSSNVLAHLSEAQSRLSDDPLPHLTFLKK